LIFYNCFTVGNSADVKNLHRCFRDLVIIFCCVFAADVDKFRLAPCSDGPAVGGVAIYSSNPQCHYIGNNAHMVGLGLRCFLFKVDRGFGAFLGCGGRSGFEALTLGNLRKKKKHEGVGR
jgi:hypothetical protein